MFYQIYNFSITDFVTFIKFTKNMILIPAEHGLHVYLLYLL